MSNRTSLRMRVLPRFPARIVATDGLTIVQENLDLVIKPDFGALTQVPSVANPTTTFFWGWDQSINMYSSISFQNLVENIQDVIIGPTTAAMEATTPSADQFIYFTGPDSAAVTGLTAAGRALLDDANAAAQRATLELGTSATLNVGATAGTVAAGDDSRIVGALQTVTAGLGQLQAPATNTVVRQIGDKMFTDTPWSFLDFIPANKHSGVKDGTLSGNLNIEIQRALDSAEKQINLPEGVIPFDTDGWTAIISTPGQNISGRGVSSKMKNKVSSGLPARPAIIVSADAADVVLSDFDVDVSTVTALNPSMGAGQIAFGIGILLMGDRGTADSVYVRNSWDGGIGVGRFDIATGVQTTSAPSDVTVINTKTFNTGRGVQTQGENPFNAGSGVNNLTGQGTKIIGCTDYGSTQGFIADFAGGASTTFVACRAVASKKSTAMVGQDIGGQGFYIGSAATLLGCDVFDSEGDGYWFDGYAAYCIARGIRAKGCRKRGLLLQGRDNSIDIEVDLASYNSAGAFPAIEVIGQSSLPGGGFGASSGLMLNTQTTGDFHSYGVVAGSGALGLSGAVTGILQGISGPIQNLRPTTFKETGWLDRGADFIRSNGQARFQKTNVSYLVQAFGDFNGNGTVFVGDVATPQKRLAMGYDPVNDVAILQAIHAGVAQKGLLFNPSGGNVGVSRGTWNTGHATMGNYHLWVDSADKLRIKNGAPVSDTDGTVVGTQS